MISIYCKELLIFANIFTWLKIKLLIFRTKQMQIKKDFISISVVLSYHNISKFILKPEKKMCWSAFAITK